MYYRKISSVLILCFFTIAAYGNNQIEIIAPAPPGGANDLFARYVSQALKSHNIDAMPINRPGADGLIGLRAGKDNKDTQTLIVASSGLALYAPLNPDRMIDIDLLKDFQPVTMLYTNYMAVVVSADSRYQNLNDLVVDLKTNPDKRTWSTGSPVVYYGCLQFLDRIKGQSIAVPYAGAVKQLTALLTKEVDFTCAFEIDLQPFLQDKRVRILASASPSRLRGHDTIPTLNERGIDLTVGSWAVLLAHKQASDQYVSMIHKIVTETIVNDKTSSLLNGRVTPWVTTPQQTKLFLEQQIAITRPLVEKYHPKSK